MSGSKSRLRDSNKTLGGVNFVQIPQRRVVPWPTPTYREILLSFCWKNGDSYIESVLLIVYDIIFVFQYILTYRAAYWLAISICYELHHFQVDFTQTKRNSFSLKGKFNFVFLKINLKYSWNSWIAELWAALLLQVASQNINNIYYSRLFSINNNNYVLVYIYTGTNTKGNIIILLSKFDFNITCIYMYLHRYYTQLSDIKKKYD